MFCKVALKMGDWMTQTHTHTLCFLTALCPHCRLVCDIEGLKQEMQLNQLQKSISWRGDAPNDGEVLLISSGGVLCLVSPLSPPCLHMLS